VRRRDFWSKEDLQILNNIAESLPPRKLVQTYNAIAAKNKRPQRTRNAIYLKCNELKLSVSPVYNTLTTDHIARCLCIDQSVVYKWIENGLNTTRGCQKARSRHYITIRDLRKFVEKHPQEFGGLDSTELFLLIEDQELVDYIKENYPKRMKRFGPMKVRCVETGEIFPSQAAACKSFHLYRSALYRAVKYGDAIAGYHFERID
jgi:hypothetical protein